MVIPNYKHKQPGTIYHTRLIDVGDKGMLLSIFEIIVIKFIPFIGKNAVTLCSVTTITYDVLADPGVFSHIDQSLAIWTLAVFHPRLLLEI
jgi:hypothetical protein